MNKGQSFLGLVLLIGGILAVTGASLAFVILSSLDTSYGYQALQSADAAASAGVQDALLQLDRNVLFASTGYIVPDGSSTATVSVTQSSTANYDTILSVATVGNRTRKIQAVVATSSSTNQVFIISEQPIQ